VPARAADLDRELHGRLELRQSIRKAASSLRNSTGKIHDGRFQIQLREKRPRSVYADAMASAKLTSVPG